MSEQIDTAYKTGAGRFIQDENALECLGAEVRRLGMKAYVIGGHNALLATEGRAAASLEAAGLPFYLREYCGPTCYEAAQRFAAEAKETGCDVVVGVGGGRIMDLSKAIAAYNASPLVEVPTSMATCAAYTPLSVMYTEEGGFRDTWRYEWEVSCVLVDLDVMAKQPSRLIAAGIMDSLAKSFEIANGKEEIDLQSESIQRFCAYEYARTNEKIIAAYGLQAYADVASRECSAAVGKMAFLNLALTGIVSSLTRGYRQTALAHKFYDGLRTLFFKEMADMLHGELVAIGLLMQDAYNRDDAISAEMQQFMRKMNMPCSIAELGIDPSDSRLESLRNYVSASEFVPSDEVSMQRFARAFERIQGWPSAESATDAHTRH